jgi:hypothetical protein
MTLILSYSPSHMKTCVRIVKLTFFGCYIIFHVSGALHVSTDVVIIRCFEHCHISVIEYISKVYTRLCANVVVRVLCCVIPVTCCVQLLHSIF